MRCLSLCVLVGLLVSRTAHADGMVWHDAYKSPFSSWGAYMYDQNVKRVMAARGGKPSSSAAVKRAPITATDFKRTGKDRTAVASWVAAKNLHGPAAAQLVTALNTTIAELEKQIRKDNVANSLVVAVALSRVTLGDKDIATKDSDELVAKVNDALAASPQFGKLRAAERQQMNDALLLSAAILVTLHQANELETAKVIAKQTLLELTGSAEL